MKRQFWSRLCRAAAGVVLGCGMLATTVAAQIPPPGPKDGSAGLQGTVQTPAPKNPASITAPTNGQVFTRMPVTVAGLCTSGLLIKVFSNNVFVGSALCENGSYTLQVDLFDGRNDLVARIFDALDQPGPDSNVVTVTYNNQNLVTGGATQLTLTSVYARRGANPGEILNWPITINGGTAPYAISVDWGDGKPATLYSSPFPGNINISHTYDSAGTYVVIVKATDKNGQTAFLQLVGQANGAVGQSNDDKSSGGGTTKVITKIIWWPSLAMLPFIAVAFWLGHKYELTELRRHLERLRQ